MLVISRAKSEKDVGHALDLILKELNDEIEMIGGAITFIECDVSVLPEPSVSITIFIEGDAPKKKFLFGVNEKGYNRENSMKKAQKRINSFIEDVEGKIAGSFVKTIQTLPGRVYTTMVVAVNEEELEDAVDADSRRKRIKKGLLLLGGDPAVLNVAKLAENFGVSRTMIYKDLEALGYKR